MVWLVLDNEENGESTTAMAEDEGFWAVEMCSRSCKRIRFWFFTAMHTDVEMKKYTIKKQLSALEETFSEEEKL